MIPSFHEDKGKQHGACSFILSASFMLLFYGTTHVNSIIIQPGHFGSITLEEK